MKSILMVLLMSGTAFAGNCHVRYYREYAAPHAVYYFVGQPIRVQALLEKENEEYQAFKAWRAQQQQAAQTSPAVQTGLVQKYCIKCHSGATPKAQFSLDVPHLTSEQFTLAMQKVMSGAMPKGVTVPPAEKGALVKELTVLTTTTPGDEE